MVRRRKNKATETRHVNVCPKHSDAYSRGRTFTVLE